ncbi:hypothetical protein CPC735_057940 [Coccidioides posadasii C735 delta SOWgp]|uniref:Tim44-like domain-containing protein n=1 Tax=Coccidioides posadasii (strain C735) TaxID=222929 RepID=C5PIS1_COCP7|nr:hypothetical protein CPC735_057940 [Coccidioides posadasii C735 delta SOWgp]EER24424.1 hypothetical protein CPC735_057940 [Coccidioides posadasii C735 delta SOWgp]|eukprot:XP_003066569.1 hypothetical protein CPC735_057940 [Coccidioides posadasii C735 delta SOWgp]
MPAAAMNSALYLPSRSLLSSLAGSATSRISIPSHSLYQLRPFSSSGNQYAAKGTFKAIKPRIPAQMSMKNRVKETMSSANRDMIPDDVGLLPGTFIRPAWRNLPSIFKEPKLRLRMEWMSLKMTVVNFIRFINKKLPLRLRERKSRALELHKQMYTSFAKYISLGPLVYYFTPGNLITDAIYSGDITSLKKTCCQGIFQNFAARISRRPRTSPRLLWTLHSYKKFPFALTFSGAQVISDRAAALPEAKGFGIRQTVIRIQSKQSLITPSSGEEQNAAQQSEKQQDCAEYVVLQRFMLNGEDGDWKVWGLAEETTPEDLETDPMFAQGLTMKDRIEMLSMRFKQ